MRSMPLNKRVAIEWPVFRALKEATMRRLRLSIFVLLAAFASNSLADCLGTDPVDTAIVFFKKHRGFYRANPAKLQGQLTERLYKALEAEYQCTRKRVCAVNFNPWTDAQHGTIGSPQGFELKASIKNKADVTMRYPTGRESKTVIIRLARDEAEGCWLVADLVTPSEVSLVRLMEAWHAQHAPPASKTK